MSPAGRPHQTIQILFAGRPNQVWMAAPGSPGELKAAPPPEAVFRLSFWTGGQGSGLFLAQFFSMYAGVSFLAVGYILGRGFQRASDYIGVVALPIFGVFMCVCVFVSLRTAFSKNARRVEIRAGSIDYPHFMRFYSGTGKGGRLPINEIRRLSIEKSGTWMENPLRATVVKLETTSGDFVLLRGPDRPTDFANLVRPAEAPRTSNSS